MEYRYNKMGWMGNVAMLARLFDCFACFLAREHTCMARSKQQEIVYVRDELHESRRGIHLTRSMGRVVICALGGIEGGREGGSE